MRGVRAQLAVVCALSWLLLACNEEGLETDAGPDGGRDAAVDAGAEADAGVPCTADSDCDDALFCNGAERCLAGRCAAGRAPSCDDGIACTEDRCREDLRECVHTAPDADMDGVRDIRCTGVDGLPLGGDCDDDDPDRFPGNAEVCDAEGHDEDCIPTTLAGPEGDVDGDGFFSAACCVQTGGGLECGRDCNDDDFAINPGAIEVCDGVDDDCDGLLDHPAEDNDADGYPDDTCAGAAATDCDDTDPETHLGATEICDRVDNDCMVRGVRRYAWDPGVEVSEDFDDDGHAPLDATCRTTRADGSPAFQADDCDDTRADVYAGALELCDGLDNDCDGAIDERAGSVTAGACLPTQLAMGGDHSCALFSDRRVVCWGEADYGQLGRESALDGDGLDVAGLTDPIQVVVGDTFSCALERDGRVICWGDSGVLNAIADHLREPDIGEVTGIRDAVELSAGASHACARLASGRVMCWGLSNQRQVDGSTTSGSTLAPVEVPGLTDAVQIESGGVHNCAVRSGGRVTCWGSNYTGMLGDGTNEPGVTEVVGLTDAEEVAAGMVHTCVRHTTGRVSCWGSNGHGQLGRAGDNSAVPVPVPGLEGVQSIRAGNSYVANSTCVLLADRTMRCWGQNDAGQLGDGTREDRVAPVGPTLPGPVEALGVGGSHACAVAAGTVHCWGAGGQGQLGSGLFVDAVTPIPSAVFAAPTEVVAGRDVACYRMPAGTVRCAGNAGFGAIGGDSAPLPETRFGPGPWRAVDVTLRHTCLVARAGTVSCFGASSRGQLGTGPGAPGELPADGMVIGITDAVDVTTGDFHSCALHTDGTVSCWGADDNGQLGDSTSAGITYVPAKMPTLRDIVQVEAGLEHTCARDGAGQVWCWGSNDRGQSGSLGTPVVRSPSRVTLPSRAMHIDSGERTTCAALETGDVFCWGNNDAGQLGAGFVGGDRAIAAAVVGLAQIVQVAVGDRHACARTATGYVLCWGDDTGGRLGNGDSAGSQSIPGGVTNLFDAADLSCGRHCCARRQSGQAVCWGNGPVQFGAAPGSDTQRPVPIALLSEP